MHHKIVEKLRKKALQSDCRYKISAIGLNKRGEVIYSAINKHRFDRSGGGLHAEMEVMKYAPPSLSTIIICRVNKNGKLLPIDPCYTCAEKANELKIKILTCQQLM